MAEPKIMIRVHCPSTVNPDATLHSEITVRAESVSEAREIIAILSEIAHYEVYDWVARELEREEQLLTSHIDWNETNEDLVK
jgi:hypothetical protein